MLKKNRFAYIVVCALVLSFMVVSINAFAAEKAKTIKGVVEAVAKDEAGNVTAVQIVNPIQKVQVVADENGKKLNQLVGKTVEASGQVIVAEGGSKTITIESFKVVEM